MMSRISFLFLSFLFVVGCAPTYDTQNRVHSNGSRTAPSAPVVVQEETATDVSLFDSDEFDLEAVTQLMVQDLQPDQIQSIVNDPQMAISNIDVLPSGGDGVRDFIVVRQNRTESEITLDFEAFAVPPRDPSTEESVNVATISAQLGADNTYQMTATYPPYASGYQNHHYSHSGMSGMEGMMLGYMMGSMLSGPSYGGYNHANYSSYQPVRVIERTTYIQSRNSNPNRSRYITRPTTISRSTRPANYTPPATSSVRNSETRVNNMGLQNMRQRTNSAANTVRPTSTARPAARPATSQPRPVQRATSPAPQRSRSMFGGSGSSSGRSSFGGGGGGFRSSGRRR
jgi:uncharacterized membrane protein YgcG